MTHVGNGPSKKTKTCTHCISSAQCQIMDQARGAVNRWPHRTSIRPGYYHSIIVAWQFPEFSRVIQLIRHGFWTSPPTTCSLCQLAEGPGQRSKPPVVQQSKQTRKPKKNPKKQQLYDTQTHINQREEIANTKAHTQIRTRSCTLWRSRHFNQAAEAQRASAWGGELCLNPWPL